MIGDLDDDDLNGDAGNDRLDGGDNGNDDDDFDGGPGIDRVVFGIIPGLTYTCTGQTVSIDMDNSPTTTAAQTDHPTTTTCGTRSSPSPGAPSVTRSPAAASPTPSPAIPAAPAATPGGNDTLNGDPNTVRRRQRHGLPRRRRGQRRLQRRRHRRVPPGFDTVTYGFPFTGHAATCSGLQSTSPRRRRQRLRRLRQHRRQRQRRHRAGDRNGVADTINATAADQAVSLFGRLGNDTLTDSTFGDFLNGEGGADTINCTNGGTDTNVLDGADTVNGSCEYRARGAAMPRS